MANADWRERSRRAEARLAALDEAIIAISRELEIDRVLQLIADRVRSLSAARYAALGIVGPDRTLEIFITSGISDAARQRIGPLPTGRGLLGALIDAEQTIRLADAGADPRAVGVPSHHFTVRTFLGVPVVARGRVVGNFYLVNKLGGVPFSEEDQDLVERFALRAGIAIDNARLLDQARRLAVVEDRDRIGRDLHDSIIQRLYGISLSLEDVPELIVETPTEAERRVERAITALHGAIGEIRTFIYGLRPAMADPGDLPRALAAVGEEVERTAALTVTTRADDVPVSPEAATELVAIARELLSNVVRHAGASRATVRLSLAGGRVRLRVTDDGRGFDPRARRPSRQRGLANVRDRATALGGRVTVRSRPGAGTVVTVSIPAEPAPRPVA
jgi:signal transduction histidine kinase